jgi:hypothetical protein
VHDLDVMLLLDFISMTGLCCGHGDLLPTVDEWFAASRVNLLQWP